MITVMVTVSTKMCLKIIISQLSRFSAIKMKFLTNKANTTFSLECILRDLHSLQAGNSACVFFYKLVLLVVFDA